ncbi:unnamed protein product [Closterium sp. NIES-54]
MCAVIDSAEGDCYLSVPPNPGIQAAALGASASAAPGAGESALSGTAPTEALHTFTLDSGASRSFFRDNTTLTPLSHPVAVSLADPSGGPVLAHSSTVLPCHAAPSGLLSGLHLPSFSTNLRVTHCTCSRTSRHLATFTRRPRSSLYTLTTASPPVSASGQVAASSQVFATASKSSHEPAPCSCRPLSHETLLWHHRLGYPSLPRLQGMASRTLRYFLLVVDDYSRYTTVFPLRSKGEVTEVLIDWIRGACRQLSERFGSDLPVLCLHSNRGGEFSSDLLRSFCRAEGIRQTFTLPASPQQNGIAKRRIGMVMDIAPTSMIHAAAPHILWPFAVQYAAHQINLQPRVSLPETTPTLRWTGKVGDASAFRVWGSRAFVRNTSADKLSSHAVPCDVTFCESVSYYRLFPYRTASLPLPPLFLAPRSPPVDPLHPQGPAPSSVSLVDPAEPVKVAVESGAARGAEPAGAGNGGAEPRGAEPERVESGGSPGVPLRREPLSPHRLRVWYTWGFCRATGAAGVGAAGGAAGAGAAGGAAGAGAAGGAAGAGAAGGALGAGAAGGAAGAGGAADAGAAGGAAAAGPGGARTGDTGAARASGTAGIGAAGPGAGGAAGVITGDPGGEGAGVLFAVSRGAARPRPYYVPLLQQPTSPLPGPSPYSGPTRGLTERREPESRPASHESRSESPVCTVRAGRRVSRPRPPPVPGTHSMTLCPSTAPQRVPLTSPPDGPDPESDSLRAASPTVTRFLATAVTDPLFESSAASALVAELVDFAAVCRQDYATSLVAESSSASVCPPSVGGECALGTDVLEDRQEEFECFAAAVPPLVSMLVALEGDPDAPDIPTPRSYAEAIEGPYSSQCQAAMEAEMASWKSTGTYVDEVPPLGANIVSGMWIFRVKRPPGSPPVFKACYVARGFSQREGVDFFKTFSPTPKMTTLRVLLHVAAQRDYELHSLDFSTIFLQGSLHEEISQRRPPGFTGSFPAST